MTKQLFDFDGYMGMVQYGPMMKIPVHEKRAPSSPGGWGLVFQASRNEFYLVRR